MHNATLISQRNVRATAFDLDVAESAMWLASKTDSVVEAVVGALAAAALAGLAFLFRSSRRKTKAVIELPLSNMLADDRRFKFGLRNVRDGTDQAAVNTIHWFKKSDGDNTRLLVVRLRYARALPDEDAVRDTCCAFSEHGVPFTIATDGPEMMRTHLRDEFELLLRIGAIDERPHPDRRHVALPSWYPWLVLAWAALFVAAAIVLLVLVLFSAT